jgi:inner membrane protein
MRCVRASTVFWPGPARRKHRRCPQPVRESTHGLDNVRNHGWAPVVGLVMASIGHVIVGLAVARAHDVTAERQEARPLRTRVAAAVVFPVLALLPDFDVVGFRLGVHYEDTWGHRGAAHSVLIAAVVAAAIALPLARGLRASVASTFVAAFVSVASHGVLDMLTDGGLGVAALWPFSDVRHFLPLHPIPVSPIGRAFLSERGLRCALTEGVLLSPFLLYAAGGQLLHRSRALAGRWR